MKPLLAGPAPVRPVFGVVGARQAAEGAGGMLWFDRSRDGRFRYAIGCPRRNIPSRQCRMLDAFGLGQFRFFFAPLIQFSELVLAIGYPRRKLPGRSR